jgi:hypothetical protein
MSYLADLLNENRLLTPTPTLLGGFGRTSALESLAQIGSFYAPSPPAPQQWAHASRRFQRFLSNIEPTPLQHEDVQTKAGGIIACLNQEYWGGPLPSGQTSLVLAGSWAKGTRIRTASDMDMIFLLPWATYTRFQSRQGNKQSDILQEVKTALQRRYPNTAIWSDGPAIILDFTTYKIEVIPAFLEGTSPKFIHDPEFKVLVCDTNDGGRYKLTAPAAEHDRVIKNNAIWNGDLVALIRMAKMWKKYCNVPIKSFLFEQMGIAFLSQWSSAGKGAGWYDWMMRDFFSFMVSRQNGYAVLPISQETVSYGNAWVSRAQTAARVAAKACDYERESLNFLAGEEWQKIFGTNIPKEV